MFYRANKNTSNCRCSNWIGKKANMKSLQRYCLETWSIIIRTRDDNKCFICGSTEYLSSHHLITRLWLSTAFNTLNGITLCAHCHSEDVVSAHNTPWILEDKLKDDRPIQYEWYLKERQLVNNKIYVYTLEKYQLILESLLVELDTLNPMLRKNNKFYRYTDKEEKNICFDYTSNYLSRYAIAKKYGCSEMNIKTILNRHGVIMRSIGRRKCQ